MDVSDYKILPMNELIRYISGQNYIVSKISYKGKGGVEVRILNAFTLHTPPLPSIYAPAIYLSLIKFRVPKAMYRALKMRKLLVINDEEDLVRETVRTIIHETIHIVLRWRVSPEAASLYDNIALKVEF